MDHHDDNEDDDESGDRITVDQMDTKGHCTTARVDLGSMRTPSSVPYGEMGELLM